MRRFFTRLSSFFFLLFILAPSAYADQQVRVLILDNQKTLTLTIKADYAIYELPSLKLLKNGKDLQGMPLVVTPKGLKFGKDEWIIGRGIRVIPSVNRDLIINKSQFRGTVDILKNKGALLYAINKLGVEEYLYGVLHHEVAHWWPMEALKAQAVAARTYALYQTQVSKVLEYDLKSSTSSQVYGGSTTEKFRTKKAVDQTIGQVLSYQGKIFSAYFHATCAGMTAAAKELWKVDLPPLAGGVKCNFCKISPHASWNAKIPLAEIEQIMNKNGRGVGQILKLEVISKTPSGRVGSVRITGTSREVVMAAKDFRIWIGGDRMRSTNFTVTVSEDMANFKGKGWGHGVGLCQWGAFGQAMLGHNYKEILEFYYPSSEIVKYESK